MYYNDTLTINSLLILGFLMVTVIIFGMSFLIKGLNKTDENIKLQQENERLKNKREQLQNEVHSLENINPTFKMQQVVINVLDIYDDSNIQLPRDIMEQLTLRTFHSEKEVYDFIENQRQNLKTESMKKTIKKVR